MTNEERIKKYEELLNNEGTRYIFLLQLNPQQGFKTIEEYKTSLETFKFIQDNYSKIKLNKKDKKEVLKFIKKGITLMYRGIHDLER